MIEAGWLWAVFTLVASAAQTAGITAEQFGAAMIGEAVAAGREALTESLLAFLPPSKREAFRAAYAAEDQLEAKADALAIAKINDPTLEERFLARVARDIDAALDAALGPAPQPEA